MQCIVLDMFLILSFGFLCLWPAAAHSRWEGQYDKCIAGGGGADTGRFLCSALFVFLCSSLSHLSPKNRGVLLYRKRGRSPHPPLLTFCPASMLLLIHIHAYAYTFPLLYFNLHNSLGQPLVKKEATDWDFIICKSGWSTALAYNILHIGLEPQIRKAISDH